MSYTPSEIATVAGPSSDPRSGRDTIGSISCAWDKLNVLTFDGGGVKGYYSLLQVQRLMEFIETAEREMEDENKLFPDHSPASSFSPCGEPRHVSHLAKYKGYLPCHYFDYIAGTSTGALITIMLARLRMPVEDCLAEYKHFGGVVFGKPGTFHQAQKAGVLFRKTKFKTRYLEEAIKDVMRRRGEVGNDHDDALPFTTPKGTCRALVLVSIDSEIKGQKDKVFLFRSYDHFHTGGRDRLRGESSGTDDIYGPRNPGSGTRFAAWKVARAATAAKLYFKPLVVVKDDGEIVRKNTRTKTTKTRRSTREPTLPPRRASSGRQAPTLDGSVFKPPETIHLTDAGYGRPNNPSEEVLRELRHLLANRNKKIDTWVSVGTARSDKDNSSNGKKRRITTSRVVLDGLHDLGDTEPGHKYMRDESRNGELFNYFRLNEHGGLNIEMDEWKQSEATDTTIDEIRASFNNWASKPENVASFQRCAKLLVQNRRERVKNRPRWERYALANFYVCGEKNCSYDCDKTWDYRDEFENHLRTHGIAEKDLPGKVNECEQHWEYKPRSGSGGSLG